MHFRIKSLRDQDPVIKQYVDQMRKRLRESCDEPVDMSARFNYVLFDGHSSTVFVIREGRFSIFSTDSKVTVSPAKSNTWHWYG